MHLLGTVMGKIHRVGIGILDHVASIQNMGPRAESLGQQRTVQPGNLVAHYHTQRVQLYSDLHLVHMAPMLHMTMPWGRVGGRKGRLKDARPVSKDPSAGGQRGYVNLGTLELCQGLLIPWYHEDKDYDYLRVRRLVGAPAANAANPSSDPESFAVESSASLNHPNASVRSNIPM